MIIKREEYIESLLAKRWNGKVKIITGIRRCGKSFLLSTLYKDYLKLEGVSEDCFIEIALDRKAYMKYRNPNELYEYVISKTQDESRRYYVFIDEIQLSYKVKNGDVDERHSEPCSHPTGDANGEVQQYGDDEKEKQDSQGGSCQ